MLDRNYGIGRIKMTNIIFKSGLPRSGSTLLTSILSQNPDIFSDKTDSLVYAVTKAWKSFSVNHISNQYEMEDLEPRRRALECLMQGFYEKSNKHTVITSSHFWIRHISLLEAIYAKKIKMIITVRAPYEIVASFEKLRQKTILDCKLSELNTDYSTIAIRADYFANTSGILGANFTVLQDALLQGYEDRLLFIDYNKFCADPEKQLKRIYKFIELPYYQHTFNNIHQLDLYYGSNSSKSVFKDMHILTNTLHDNQYSYNNIIGNNLVQHYNTSFWEHLT